MVIDKYVTLVTGKMNLYAYNKRTQSIKVKKNRHIRNNPDRKEIRDRTKTRLTINPSPTKINLPIHQFGESKVITPG